MLLYVNIYKTIVYNIISNLFPKQAESYCLSVIEGTYKKQIEKLACSRENLYDVKQINDKTD